jgi:hypothetical protein
MTTVTSETRQLPCPQQRAYELLSDLENLSKVKEHVSPENWKNDLVYDHDSCGFAVPGIGRLRLRIFERQAPTTIRFDIKNAPCSGTMQIDLQPTADNENTTDVRVTILLDIPVIFRTATLLPLQEGVNHMVDFLAELPLDKI